MNFAYQAPFKFFKVEDLFIQTIQRGSRFTNNFISSILPEKINNFGLSIQTFAGLNDSLYFKEIIRISHKILKSVVIFGFKITPAKLRRFFSSFSHVEDIRLSYCELLIADAPDFSELLVNTQIQKLTLIRVDFYDLSGSEDNPEGFATLIKGLASSSHFKLNLQELRIHLDDFTQDEIIMIIGENGFDKAILKE
ncbi:unnamed protein product [Moneuplotes crassus]|uniref:Uncharacterized protein n=1 Tax=Euplotes crassus TaxID=5936 RepID=A0AAD1UJY4_EUPCR|nr:unnamed protein product [Moneuplotes crassus]